MAIEVFPDSPSVGMSPRISFSHDLTQTDVIPIEQYIRSGSSSIDFDFCVFRETFDQESSSADELFFDGKILPIEIKKRLAPPRTADEPPPPPPLPPLPLPPAFPPLPPSLHPQINRSGKSTIIHETKNSNSESAEKQQNYKSSFWSFKRSTSLNCGSGYARTLCPLPLLSRSNSTGSTASSKRSSVSNSQKQNFIRHSPNNPTKQSQFASSSSSSTNHQRPPLKKTNHPYNNGIKFNPVLNVPQANLFGLGSIFSAGKDKNKNKKKH